MNYPGIYEDGKLLARFVVPLIMASNQPVFSGDTLSLKRRTVKRAPQRWELTTNLEPLSASAEDLFVLMTTKGAGDKIDVMVPQNYGATLKLTSKSSAPKTQAGYGAGTSQLLIKEISGVIPKGWFIRFMNHSKIYMLTSPLTSDGVLNVFPPLRIPVPIDTIFTYNDVMMNAEFDYDNVRGMVYNDGILMDNGTIKLIEQL